MVLSAFIAVFGYAASASETTDEAKVKAGRELAMLVCSACHVALPDQSIPPSLLVPGPSFEEIANRPGTTVKSIENFLATTHGNLQARGQRMPDPMLMDFQKVEVVAYIMSLRRKP